MSKSGKWYRAFVIDEDGPEIFLEITEAEAAAEIGFVIRRDGAEWRFFRCRGGKHVYSHRIVYSKDVRARLAGQGRKPISDGEYARWKGGLRRPR